MPAAAVAVGAYRRKPNDDGGDDVPPVRVQIGRQSLQLSKDLAHIGPLESLAVSWQPSVSSYETAYVG